MHTVLAWFCLLYAIPEPLPPLSDLQRFPPLWLVQDQLALSTSHQNWLQFRIDTERFNHTELSLWLIEARRHAEPWVVLEGIIQGHDEWAGFEQHHTDIQKQQRLNELRRLIGPQAYREGWLPSIMPLHRFKRGWDVPVLTHPARLRDCKDH